MHSSATVLECEAVKDTRTASDFKHRPNAGMGKTKITVYLNSKTDNTDTVSAYFVNFFIEQIGSKSNASNLYLRVVQSESQLQQ
jgi:hypothetical protein